MSARSGLCSFCGAPITHEDGLCCQDPVCESDFDEWIFALEMDEEYVLAEQEKSDEAQRTL